MDGVGRTQGKGKDRFDFPFVCFFVDTHSFLFCLNRVDAVEELKRPLLPFIKAYETGMETQGGMFLYPLALLKDVNTPQALETQ